MGIVNNWIDNCIPPLLSLLDCIRIIEENIVGVGRVEFLESEDIDHEQIQDNIIAVSEHLEGLKQNCPKIFQKYNNITWDKYIKLGKALGEGHWPFIYNLVWKMASVGISEIKTVANEILELS